MTTATFQTLLDNFRAGKRAALARAMTLVEDGRADGDALLGAVHADLGRARRIGITGPPGAGKSTITTRLAGQFRDEGLSVGIIAVDPTSPFTGGALLGDRVRMESVALDPGVFIRSMATRGSLGGLAGTTRELCDVLDAFGMDRILIETVGVGQSELEIARTADQSVVMLVPESGDSIQSMKAGLMEIADIFVVNKADRPGADRVKHDIEAMLGLRGGLPVGEDPAHHGVDLKRVANPAKIARQAAAKDSDAWTPPVVLTIGSTGQGLPEVVTALDRHFGYLEKGGVLAARRRTRIRQRVVDVVQDRVRQRLWLDAATNAWLDAKLPDVESGAATPFAVADALLARSGKCPDRSEVMTGVHGGRTDADETIAAMQQELDALRAQVAAWQARYATGKVRDLNFTNSAKELAPLYTALDLEGSAGTATETPGEYPFTRGIHPTGYRGRLWTMRQFAGFGSAKETNERYKFLLAHGTTGLSVAFDFPTLMGYDSDHPRSEGEVGKCGVAITSLADMETLFDGIPLGDVSTSMTINGPAIILWCFYIAAAEKQGVSADKLRGTVQNDILKEYMAQHAWCFPIEPALRLIVDMFEWGAKHAPQWNTISISGYHIREAGATAAQELAFTLADGFTYVERGIARGLPVDEFAPRLSYFWDVHNDFFEEIAKLRAARRIWARHMKERYGAKDPKSWMMRFHSQTAGVTLTAQQPMNNVVRVAYQALAAALGGTQSLHTNSMDETLALPTEEAVQVALRTQQVLAYETGVPNVSDPLGGSYYVEKLTDDLEREAEAIFAQIEEKGGVVKCLEAGYLQRKIAESAARQQWEIEQHRRIIVGVNAFETDESALAIPLLKMDEQATAEQGERLRKLRSTRDNALCTQRLDRLREAARGSENVVPHILDCARCYCTLYEIRAALEDVFGAYREPVFF